jgi:DnaJ-class molecular chaperone
MQTEQPAGAGPVLSDRLCRYCDGEGVNPFFGGTGQNDRECPKCGGTGRRKAKGKRTDTNAEPGWWKMRHLFMGLPK